MIIAGIVCGVLYSQMKTARLKTEANDYIGAGLKLRVQVDNYTHTDRVQVYDPPHEESSSSGGSSVIFGVPCRVMNSVCVYFALWFVRHSSG